MKKSISHYKDSKILHIINILIEYLLIICAYYLSGFVRIQLPTSIAKAFWWKDILEYPYLAFLEAFVIVFVYYLFKDYATIHIRNNIVELAWIIVIQMLGTLFMSGFLFMVNGWQFSRWWLLLFGVISTLIIYFKRVVFQFIATKVFGKLVAAYKVVLIGNGECARDFYAQVHRIGDEHYQMVGYFAAEPNASMDGYLGDVGNLQEVLSKNPVTQVVIAEESLSAEGLKAALSVCSIYGIAVYVIPVFGDYLSDAYRWNNPDPFVKTFGGSFKIFRANAMNKRNILGVNISVTNMDKTIRQIDENLDDWRGNYICVSNVHTTVMAYDSDSYRDIQNGAVMALPDGGPLSSYSRSNGDREAQRVTGPDLMREILKMSEVKGWKHFFYGSTQETLDKLAEVLPERYPGVQIAGMISPPFRELTPEEDNAYIEQINEAKPDFLWVGLGAPKQEVWMAAHKARVNCLMIGVGAAFDYESGNIKRAPKWMQKMSLEWLYRLMQDPRRLFKRYITTNVKYLWLTRR